MLTRSLHVKGVSRFQSSRAVEMAKGTVIYAENGRGKTTLSAVLRSLQTGEAFHILERKTLGATGLPTIGFVGSFSSGNTQFVFDGKAWNATLAACEIFDTKFISDNVYSGDQVDPEHRRHLHRFVLGAGNVSLANKVDEIDSDVRALNAEVSSMEAAIMGSIFGGLDLEVFLRLPLVADITTKILGQERKIAAARQAQGIRTTEKFGQVLLPEFDGAALDAVLMRSLADIEREAEKQVRAHLASRLDAGGEEWLARGLTYLERRPDCPFCGTDTTSIPLVAAYKGFFSASYNAHRRDIAVAGRSIGEYLSEACIRGLEGAVAANANLAAFWGMLSVPALPGLSVTDIREALEQVRRAYQARFILKQQDVLVPVEPGPEALAAMATLATLRTQVAAYNAAVHLANDAIATLKEQAGNADLEKERQILALLKSSEVRHEPEVASRCNALLEGREQKRHLEQQKHSAKEELDEATEKLFSQYQAALNRHLTNCGCGYTITGTKTSYAGGKPRTEYQLKFDQHVVELNAPKGKAEAPSFKNTLSDGDRSTLAFALFLARLEIDPGIDDKIVVLDDPMTSLDAHRRAYTCQQIAQLALKCRQIVMLTHDAVFAREVWERLPKPKTALQIQRQGTDSVLSEWSILEETRSDYFKLWVVVQGYIDGQPVQDKRSVATALRPLLEGNLRMRFPRQFGPDQWLGDFISAIKHSTPDDYLYGMQSQLQELSDLNDYSKQFHHDQNPGAASVSLADGELQVFAKRTMAFLSGM